jgi:hypothetical protein
MAMALLAASSSPYAIPSGGDIPIGVEQSRIILKKYEPSTSELPATAYLIPHSSFVLFAPSKAANMSTISALLGPLGVVIGNEIGKTSTSQILGEADFVMPDLTAIGNELFGKETTQGATEKLLLEVTPSGFLNANEAGDKGSLVVILEATWRNSDSEPSWRQKYLYHVMGERPFVGPEGWFSKENTLLLEASKTGISRLAAIFLSDRAKKSSYGDTETKLGGCFGYAKKLTLLAETAEESVIRVQGNRATGASVHVLHPGQCNIGAK